MRRRNLLDWKEKSRMGINRLIIVRRRSAYFVNCGVNCLQIPVGGATSEALRTGGSAHVFR